MVNWQIKEKEMKTSEEKDARVAEATKRKKLIASLPSAFDMILLIFQSRNRSVITKRELIQRIIANNRKIVDRGNAKFFVSNYFDYCPCLVKLRFSL